MDQTLALGASKYMKDENHYVPWTALNRNVGYMLQMLAGTNSSTLLRVWKLGYKKMNFENILC